MAESRGSGEKGNKMLSFVAKKTRRAHQKMLEKAGKSEKTTDDNYTNFVRNFNRQQLAASRLQKELQKYFTSLKAVAANSKSLMEVWMEYYEQQWVGHDEVSRIVENKMLLWEDLLNRVNSDMVETLQLYMSKFPETKKVVEKRERKIVDYDYTKRVLEEIRQKPKVTEVKVQQAEEAYVQAKQAFDDVTNSLYDELPALYDSRIEFYSKFFTNMTSIENKFHEEMSKLDSRYNEIMGDLASEAESGKHSSRRDRVTEPDSVLADPHKNSDEESPETSSVNVEESQTGEVEESQTGEVEESQTGEVEESQTGEKDENLSVTESFASAHEGEGSAVVSPTRTSSGKDSPIRTPPSKPQRIDSNSQHDDEDDDVTADHATQENQKEAVDDIVVESKQPPPKPAKLPSVSSAENDTTGQSVPINSEIPTDSKDEDEDTGEDKTDENQPVTDQTDLEANPKTDEIPDVIEKRVATHPYTGEDDDELSFEKGDVILVIPYEVQDDEEDEGWKMGIIEGTTKRGVFPENFTKLLQ